MGWGLAPTASHCTKHAADGAKGSASCRVGRRDGGPRSGGATLTWLGVGVGVSVRVRVRGSGRGRGRGRGRLRVRVRVRRRHAHCLS